MKLNIISDLHCSFNEKENKVVWNGSDKIPKKDKKNAIYNLKKTIKYSQEHSNEINNYLSNINKAFGNSNECIEYLNKALDYINKWDYDDITDVRKVRNACSDVFDILYDTKYKESYNNMYSVIYCLNYLYSLFIPEKLHSADYLIVAGDLGLDDTYQLVYDELKERTQDKFKDVFFIKGNHDYWWFPNNKRTYKDEPEDINFDHRYFEKEINEYLFLGCTLWAPVRTQNIYRVQAMNDYRYIPGLNKLHIPFSTDRLTSIYEEESNWLRNKVNANKDKKIIIFTHHMPRKELIDDDFKYSDINDAYAVMDGSCDDIKPLVWISGHTHRYDDRTLNGVRYIRNPIGYRHHYGYVPSEVDPRHWYNTVIDV